MKSDIEVIYIAGNGHSGSTLLDIIVGTNAAVFSLGELTYITREGIRDEYCSCNTPIGRCEFWSEVLGRWERDRAISEEEYTRLRNKLEGRRGLGVFLRNFFRPSQEITAYCDATLLLLKCIQEVSGKSIFVDSSKNPQRIAVLRRITGLKVLHICRSFTGVLNSSKNTLKKDISAGVESDSSPRRTYRVLLDWIVTNVLCHMFVIGLASRKVRYEDLVGKAEHLERLQVEFLGMPKPPSVRCFRGEHLMAGNAMRLKNEIIVNRSIGFRFGRLTTTQLRIGRVMDSIFWFWS